MFLVVSAFVFVLILWFECIFVPDFLQFLVVTVHDPFVTFVLITCFASTIIMLLFALAKAEQDIINLQRLLRLAHIEIDDAHADLLETQEALAALRQLG